VSVSQAIFFQLVPETIKEKIFGKYRRVSRANKIYHPSLQPNLPSMATSFRVYHGMHLLIGSNSGSASRKRHS